MKKVFKNSYGFTVIESLIAIVILSIALVSIMSMQIMSIKINSSSIIITDVVNIAQDRMEQIMAMPYSDDNLKDNNADIGVFTSYTDTNPPQGFVIEWEVDENSPAMNNKTIRLRVKRSHKDGQKDVSFEFIKANI